MAVCGIEWELNNVHSTQEAGADSLTGYESETYGNRVNYCLVTSPAGRLIHEYQSVRELLEALHDAIRGHKSLLEDGRILHRDISENNIIITESSVEGTRKVWDPSLFSKGGPPLCVFGVLNSTNPLDWHVGILVF